MLAYNHHGKGRVRVVKVRRTPERHEVQELTVETILIGPVDEAFTKGDNSIVVATDTQKNTVYAVAQKHDFKSAEEFALILAEHFVTEYPKLVTTCRVTIDEDIWERIVDDKSGQPHHHAFRKAGPVRGYVCAEVSSSPSGLKKSLNAGVRALTLLKTTQSAFTNFVKDKYTLLPDVEDRLLGSAIDVTWTFSDAAIECPEDGYFKTASEKILAALTREFAGPPDTGVLSVSVQATLLDMGRAALADVPGISSISMQAPNIHNIPWDGKGLGMQNADATGAPDVFVATSEPHGIIFATVARENADKSVNKLPPAAPYPGGDALCTCLFFEEFIPRSLRQLLLRQAKPVGRSSILLLPPPANSSSASSAPTTGDDEPALTFLHTLLQEVSPALATILQQRQNDRFFVDRRLKTLCHSRCSSLFPTASIVGQMNEEGAIVVGPLQPDFHGAGGDNTAAAAGKAPKQVTLPPHLSGPHVTMFGTADSVAACEHALKGIGSTVNFGGPGGVGNGVAGSGGAAGAGGVCAKWGADMEDSQVPLPELLQQARTNLGLCYRSIEAEGQPSKSIIVRLPGLGQPAVFAFDSKTGAPVPLHLYCFALHLFQHWNQPSALTFYVPKLESEEDARYLCTVISKAEDLIKKTHSTYTLGTVRVILVIENARAIFRVNEMAEALYPYFAGASLGWHDYLASTARVFKEGPHWSMPSKLDPNIVVRHIQVQHELLSRVVKRHGGVSIGGMYGVVPVDHEPASASYQVSLRGYFRDVIAQLRRGLQGFWVAYPPFVPIGLEIVLAWRLTEGKDSSAAAVGAVAKKHLQPKYADEIMRVLAVQETSVDVHDVEYARSLLLDKPSSSSSSSTSSKTSALSEEDMRLNVSQTLHYLTQWLSGNGNVTLPTAVDGVTVSVVDDLATVERSRWTLWHDLRHGSLSLSRFLTVAHEEAHKATQKAQAALAKEGGQPAGPAAMALKWGRVALAVMLKLITDMEQPVEFVPELLTPFIAAPLRAYSDPLATLAVIKDEVVPEDKKFALGLKTINVRGCSDKLKLTPWIERWCYFFDRCGCARFADIMAENMVLDLASMDAAILSMTLSEVIEAAGFHGDIGGAVSTMDEKAKKEQAAVLSGDEAVRAELRALGAKYREKFGVKFLISAHGKTGPELRAALNARMNNTAEQELVNAREALSAITAKRVAAVPPPALLVVDKKELEALQQRYGVVGASLSVTAAGADSKQQTVCFGVRTRGEETGGKEQPVTEGTLWEIASLSKSIGTAFAMEYFHARGIPLETSVNKVLEQCGSTFRVTMPADADKHEGISGDDVQLVHIMSHSALNLHYVNGVPLTSGGALPNVRALLDGYKDPFYEPVCVLAGQGKPGSFFRYSGAGFLVLQHIIECFEGGKKSIDEITAPFLAKILQQPSSLSPSLSSLTFEADPARKNASTAVACGYDDQGKQIAGTRKVFPAFAAGALGTPAAVMQFLRCLGNARANPEGCGPISHDTAVRMLHGTDKGCEAFMGVRMGVGIFTAEAGANRLAIHQGANDGFRAVFVYCYKGPDAGAGFVMCSTGDNQGMLFISEVSQTVFRALKMQGVDCSKFQTASAALENVPQEEQVNIGYKTLVFDAFQKDLPEVMAHSDQESPLAPFNAALDARVVRVTDESFSRANNLLSRWLPTFDATLFGRHGKMMDSWETARHNPADYEELVIELKEPMQIKYVWLSTQFHKGNHFKELEVLGLGPASSSAGEGSKKMDDAAATVTVLIPLRQMEGHADLRVTMADDVACVTVSRVMIRAYPDGGLSRLGLFAADLPAAFAKDFAPLDKVKSVPFEGSIPRTARPLVLEYKPSAEDVARNFALLELARKEHGLKEFDAASKAYGGRLVSATNEHYGAATQTISPYPAMDMADGFESARSHDRSHHEELVIELCRACPVHRLELDFTHFVHNNPAEVSVLGGVGGSGCIPAVWRELAPRTSVKEFAGNTKTFEIKDTGDVDHLKIMVYPDGGINRIRAFTSL